jgi:signal transduction histidine kinase
MKSPIEKFLDKHYHTLKIGQKLSLNLIFVGTIGLILCMLFIKFAVYERLDKLEQTQMQQHTAQLNSYLIDAKKIVRNKDLDWSNWDDAYQYVQDFNPEFANKNTYYEALHDFGINGIAFVNFEKNDGNILVYDSETGQLDKKATSSFKSIILAPEFVDKIKKVNDFQSFVRIGNRLYALSSSQVLTSEKSGPLKGYMVLLEEMTSQKLQNSLHTQTNIDFVKQRENAKYHYMKNSVLASVSVNDANNLPIARITSDLPRNINVVKSSLLWSLVFGVFIVMLGAISIFYMRLRKLVLEPIAQIDNHLRAISDNGEITKINFNNREDEIGSLAKSFNLMSDKLHELHEKLERESYQLGKIQNQTDILHNVKNTLSPFRVLMSKFFDLIIPNNQNFYRAINELENNNLDSQRREKLVQYLNVALVTNDENVMRARKLANEAQEHLRNIVETLQSSGKPKNAANISENCNISNVIDNALNIARHSDKAVEIEFDGKFPVEVKANRILMSQLFDNIIVNAIEAISQSSNDNGKIAVEINKIDNNGASLVEISVNDNGDGIDPQIANKLFERGFSTREYKSGGLGLHWCANTLNAIGGTIKLDSQGKGKGTKVKITIPASIAA